MFQSQLSDIGPWIYVISKSDTKFQSFKQKFLFDSPEMMKSTLIILNLWILSGKTFNMM